MRRGLLRAATCALLLTQASLNAQQPIATAAVTNNAPTPQQRRAAGKEYLKGAHAVETQDLRTAFTAFSDAARLDSTNADYRGAAVMAKAHFISELIQEADKARIVGKNDVARARLAEAFAIDPENPMVAQHANDLAQMAGDAPHASFTPEIADAIQLEPESSSHSFHVRADAQTLLRQVLAAYGIQASFDASVPTQVVRFDADDLNYKQAAQVLSLQTNCFFVPLDPHRVLIAKDTRENRANFERLLVETVDLPALSSTELTDIGNLARNVLDITQASVQPESHRLTVRGPESRIDLLNRTLDGLLAGRSQVLLEVKILEVARSRTQNVGVQLPQQFQAFNLTTVYNQLVQQNQAAVQQIISSGLASAGDFATIAAILIASGVAGSSILSQGFALFGGGLTETGLTLGSVTANAALNTSDSRAIDQLQLRLQDQEAGDILAGLRYPILQSSYSNLSSTSAIAGLSAAGTSAQLTALGLNSAAISQPIPQVQYQDLGLSLKATPHIHRDQTIALKLDLKVQALGGSVLNDIPVITNRQFTADLTVKDGESALVSSNLTTSESRAISGLPGLSDIPGLRSTTDKNVQRSADELVILMTPHIVRLPHASGASQVMLLPAHQ